MTADGEEHLVVGSDPYSHRRVKVGEDVGTLLRVLGDGHRCGDARDEPLLDLLCGTADSEHTTTITDDEAVETTFRRTHLEHAGTKQKTAPKGGLLHDDSVTAAWARLFTDHASDGVSHEPHMVELGGIEPPSNAGSPRFLRAQSVQTFYLAPTFVTDT